MPCCIKWLSLGDFDEYFCLCSDRCLWLVVSFAPVPERFFFSSRLIHFLPNAFFFPTDGLRFFFRRWEILILLHVQIAASELLSPLPQKIIPTINNDDVFPLFVFSFPNFCLYHYGKRKQHWFLSAWKIPACLLTRNGNPGKRWTTMERRLGRFDFGFGVYDSVSRGNWRPVEIWENVFGKTESAEMVVVDSECFFFVFRGRF